MLLLQVVLQELSKLMTSNKYKFMLKFKYTFLFFYNMGISWVFNRTIYEIKKRLGYFKILNKIILNSENKVKLKSNLILNPFFLPKKLNNLESFIIAEKLFTGEIKIFCYEYESYLMNGNINWHYQPILKRDAKLDKEWQEIPDFSEFGDIKLIWEPSRFSYTTHIINCFLHSGNEKYAILLKDLIVDWINKNPFPYGINYKCGQEISFRLFQWIIACNIFQNFFSINEKELVLKNIYVSIKRIESNISYSVKSVKNNHSISEAAGLLVCGLLFPQLPQSKRWIRKGETLLLQETKYQIFDDGSYIQHSMNYHRLAMDVISFVLFVAKKVDYKLPEVIYERHKKMYLFLVSFVQKDGKVPNYGPNDGAYLFPLSNYQDFRASINFASAINQSEIIFKNNNSIIDFFGLDIKRNNFNIQKLNNFKIGGYYQLRFKNLYCFVRCHTYKTRPSHSDTLHLDVWVNGKNIFCDTGSYSYNTSMETKNHFISLFGHNTVVIDNNDFMKPVFNFGMTNWPQARVISFDEKNFIGEHYGYKIINGITHRRNIMLKENIILVKDLLFGIKKKTLISQLWHTEYSIKRITDYKFQIENLYITSNIEGHIRPSKVSRYYNSYVDSSMLLFSIEVDNDFEIETIIKIN